MEKSELLLRYEEINKLWLESMKDTDAAKALTLKQINSFSEIISDDDSWNFLISVFQKGRQDDAWLANDWPDGFDELLLCVPLCKLVDFECSKCAIGKRQKNNSCAHDDSVFGYTAEILKTKDRERLIHHIEDIKTLLTSENHKWNMETHTVEII